MQSDQFRERESKRRINLVQNHVNGDVLDNDERLMVNVSEYGHHHLSTTRVRKKKYICEKLINL